MDFFLSLFGHANIKQALEDSPKYPKFWENMSRRSLSCDNKKEKQAHFIFCEECKQSSRRA